MTVLITAFLKEGSKKVETSEKNLKFRRKPLKSPWKELWGSVHEPYTLAYFCQVLTGDKVSQKTIQLKNTLFIIVIPRPKNS
jgi:hypothetical protein